MSHWTQHKTKHSIGLSLFITLLLIATFASISLAAPAPLSVDKPSIPSPPVQRKVLDYRFEAFVLPAGNTIQVVSQTPMSTANNRVGDPIEAIVNQNVYLGAMRLIPFNTRVFGKINRIEPAVAGGDAVLAISYDSIAMNNGEESLPIKAHVNTGRDDHSWGGQATHGTVPYMSTQRLRYNDEYNRTQYGGAWAMGKAIVMPPGDFWTIVLDEPLTIVRPRRRPVQEEEEDATEGRIFHF